MARKAPARRRPSAAGQAPPGRPRRPARPARPARPEPPADRRARAPRFPEGTFPIIGIGSSAGGLEALEQFLTHVPENSGTAYVIVQHLDPGRKEDMLTEILQRSTPMPVVQVKDGTRVKPNSVYVIPPNRNMSLLHGTLHLLEPVTPRGLRLPIDFFFRSLAEDQHERSVGIILSGMGSDGTLGLRAIKEKAGLALVQDPKTAKFDGMPRSAIDAGVADVVAPAETLAERMQAHLQRAPFVAAVLPPAEAEARNSLDKVVIVLRARTGHDFSQYKRSTLYRRVERRMGIHQMDAIATYVRFLQDNPHEAELLFKELLITVTSFFRDPPAWKILLEEVFPDLLTRHPGGGVLRAWVPACATGEEAYSLAMAFGEAVSRQKVKSTHTLQIFATDLDRDAIDRARGGFYPPNIAADVSPERLSRFFTKEENGYRVNRETREMVIFAVQNLIQDPPFTKLDLLSCRNLLIYLEPALQKKLLPLFHYSLNPGGYLFLGSAESVGAFTSLFGNVHNKARLFRRLDQIGRPADVEFPLSVFAPAAPPQARQREGTPLNLPALVESVLLERFGPTAVLATREGDIIYVSGRTGRYLEAAAGKANWNVFVMAREGLHFELTRLFRQALRRNGTARAEGIELADNGSKHHVDVTVEALHEPEPMRGMVLVSFRESVSRVIVAPERKGRVARTGEILTLRRELQRMREELQTTREEMQTSQEELRSSNEELQSANEELQSTNEELTTSKEEMQSLNEELQTVNSELQAKVDDLSRANSDMKNLLDSTDVATIFLDGDLNIRRFTLQATRIVKLIPTDVGRPISDLTSDLDYPELIEDARLVLQTLATVAKDVPSRSGRWFAVKIMPYRTLDNRIDGLVITLGDVTDRRIASDAAR